MVSYKTIVKRLYELDFIDKNKYKYYIENVKIKEDVKLWQERLKMCGRNNERTNKIKLVDMSVELYERKLVTYDKLEYLLNLSGMKPGDLKITEEKFTDYN